MRDSIGTKVALRRAAATGPALVFGLLAGFRCPAAMGATFSVTTTQDTVAVDPAASPKDENGDVSLRSAIMAANAHSGADTIELQPGAVYRLSLGPSDSGLGDINDARGDLDIADTLTILGNDATVDANGIDRAFSVENAGLTDFEVRMRDLTVTGGAPKGFLSPGGGISVRASSLVMDRCAVTGNSTVEDGSTDNGGGIAANGVLFPVSITATLTLTTCIVSGNTANNGGGIVAGDCILFVEGCLVSGNRATGADAGTGGAGIFLTGSRTEAAIDGSRISEGVGASDGGGLSVFTASMRLARTGVHGNETAGNGGGIFNSGVSPGQIALLGVTVAGNTADRDADGAGSGGGILNGGGLVTISSSTISTNTAALGGGIAGSGNTEMRGVTVARNEALAGGGIASSEPVTARNTLIGDNMAATGPDVLGSLVSAGYNLIEDVTDAALSGVMDGVVLGVSPRIMPLADNGGPTRTHALQPDSPAVDAGDPAEFLATDQRGVPRPIDGDRDGTPLPDIGAYELRPPLTLRDAARALRIAGGLLAAAPGDATYLDVESGTPGISLSDALRVARMAATGTPNG